MFDGVGKCQTSKVIGSLNIHDGQRSYVRMYVCMYVCMYAHMYVYYAVCSYTYVRT